MKKRILPVLSVIILCLASAAPAAATELPAFTSVRDVLDRTEEIVEIVADDEYIVLILETDGGYIRMVALPDDRAKALYQAAAGENACVSDMEAFNEYAYTLPFSYMEKLAEMPKSRAELDALKGKTIQELMDEGFDSEMIIGFSRSAFEPGSRE